jgi:hypothetical protein
VPFFETVGSLWLKPGLVFSRELSCDVAVIGGGTGECAAGAGGSA